MSSKVYYTDFRATPQETLPQKLAEEDPNHEHFHLNHPNTEWEACLEHAEKIGVGTREYELVRI